MRLLPNAILDVRKNDIKTSLQCKQKHPGAIHPIQQLIHFDKHNLI